MKSFATRQSSRTTAPPASPRSPLLSPARNLSESTAERQASQAATHAMQRGITSPALGATTHPTTHHLSAPTQTSQPSLFRTPGHPLDPSTRSLMESRFQFDFSRIRIHNDPAAHQAADRLSARAFAHGRDIAFAPGQYKPSSAEGQHLLAHELAHTIQQANSPEPVIRRDAKLHGATTFGERDSGKIDKVIAADPTIKRFIDAKSLKTLSGNVDQELPDVFAAQFQKYGKSQEDNVDEIPGFVYRGQAKPIKLRAPGTSSTTKQPVLAATYEVAVHETVHLNSRPEFQNAFGHPCNEGVTEYFTEKILGEDGKAYREQVALVTGLRDALNPDGEKQIGDAYFKGAKPLLDKLNVTFSKTKGKITYTNWHTKISSDKPADWPISNKLLTDALSTPAPQQAPSGAANPSSGLESDSDAEAAPLRPQTTNRVESTARESEKKKPGDPDM